MTRDETGAGSVGEGPLGSSVQTEPSVDRSVPEAALEGTGRAAAGDWPIQTLSVEVSSFPIPLLLGLIHGAGRSGSLRFQHASLEKVVYLNRGEVVFAASNLASDGLAASLLRAGWLDGSQISQAEHRQRAGARFGKIVVELGYLTPGQLWAGIERQVEEIVRSLFLHPSGRIQFWEGEAASANVVQLGLSTQRLIEEGLLVRQDWLGFKARLENETARVALTGVPRIRSSAEEEIVCKALAHETAFSGIVRRCGLDPISVARVIYCLQAAGRVTVDCRGGSESPPRKTPKDDAVRREVALHLRLIEELTAPLIAFDGPKAVAQRLNQVVEENALHGFALFDTVRFDERATLHPTEVEESALRLTGDRSRAVGEALGELICWLEFELKNHPRIDDSAAFFEAVDPLRAMLAR